MQRAFKWLIRTNSDCTVPRRRRVCDEWEQKTPANKAAIIGPNLADIRQRTIIILNIVTRKQYALIQLALFRNISPTEQLSNNQPDKFFP